MYVFVFALGIATLVLLWRNHPFGYLATWVFAILAPTSLVPIVTEVAAERPHVRAARGGSLSSQSSVSACSPQIPSIVASSGEKSLLPQRKGRATDSRPRRSLAFIVAILFALVDVKHLNAYRDEMTLWREVIQQQPDNVVAHDDLSSVLIHAGRFSEAAAVSQALLAVKPDQPIALNSLRSRALCRWDVTPKLLKICGEPFI